MENCVLTFDESMKKEILSIFGKTVDNDGLIVEKDNPSQKVLSEDGQEVNIKEFGGIKKGSEIFIKNDLISLMRLSKE
jgi:hypothetical protein